MLTITFLLEGKWGFYCFTVRIFFSIYLACRRENFSTSCKYYSRRALRDPTLIFLHFSYWYVFHMWSSYVMPSLLVLLIFLSMFLFMQGYQTIIYPLLWLFPLLLRSPYALLSRSLSPPWNSAIVSLIVTPFNIHLNEISCH